MQQNRFQTTFKNLPKSNQRRINQNPLIIKNPSNALLSETNFFMSDKALNRAKKNLKDRKYFSARNQLFAIFEQKKTIEIALLISDCFTQLREFKQAVKFFEKYLNSFENDGTYWGILALHNFASEDFEGAAGAAFNSIEKFKLDLLELWKIFVHASKKIERRDVLYHICKKHVPNPINSSFSEITKNPFLIEGYLTSCFDNNRDEGWSYVKEAGIDIENVSQFGEVSGVICGLISSLIPDSQDRLKDALIWNTKAKELDPNNSYIRWNLSDLQLKSGLIDEGVQNYECRFLWDQFPSYIRKFKKPHWNPDIKKDSTIMVWYEQGIGDQIRFMSAIRDFQNEFPNLIIETSEKTFDILKNSFPNIEVRLSTMNADLTTNSEDFDYHIPSGTLFYYLIKQNSEKFLDINFSLFKPFLFPDKLRQHYWKHKLDSQTKKPKIGICWTSSMQNSNRSKNYTSLEKWADLITNKEFSFVNLQYNVHMDEILAKGDITRNFLNTNFLDQWDDLEGVISLISNLDYVVSTSASPSMLASSVGVPTLIFSTINKDWLGRSQRFDQHPLFAKTSIYPTIDAENDKKIVPEITSWLEKKFL
jgi:ADP-heptose:LPS heptosyltransferase